MLNPTPLSLGFLGGTGAEGAALALRYAQAGHPVAIGSRSLERAQQAADAINQRLGSTLASPHENRGAVLASSVVFLTIPYSGLQDTLAPVAGEMAERIVISTIVPMIFQDRRPLLQSVPAGSAAQEVQLALPNAKVVAALHHVSARHLEDVEHPLEEDVLLCGDSAEAKTAALELLAELEGARAFDVGGLEYAHSLEALTPVLLSLNRRYRVQSGLRLSGITEP